MTRRILGIDPGLTHTGWGVIEHKGSSLTYIAAGHISPPPKAETPARLKQLHDEILRVVKLHKPDTAAIEETFVNKNALSSLKLGQARGALMLSLSLVNLSVAEYASTAVKKALTGNGHAEKHQVSAMVRMLLRCEEAASADAMDALAVAITHAHAGCRG